MRTNDINVNSIILSCKSEFYFQICKSSYLVFILLPLFQNVTYKNIHIIYCTYVKIYFEKFWSV